MSKSTNAIYRPYNCINSVEDLLLIREKYNSLPDAAKLPQAHYPGEAIFWLEIDARPENLFSPEGETLFAAEADKGLRGWQLSFSPYGYLHFESGEGKDKLWVKSKVPLFSFLRDGEAFRVGVAISNCSYSLRGTGYEKENTAFNRIRLYVAPGPGADFTLCGWASDFLVPDLAAVPRRLVFRDGKTPAFRGRITGVTGYNVPYAEMFNKPGIPSADDVIPPVPGGGAFHARWIEKDAVEVYTRPEFLGTLSSWVYMRIADSSARLRHVCLRSLWSGVATMNPNFFISADGDHWERIVPEKIEIRPDSTLYTAWLKLDARQPRKCYISSAIPFLPRHREEFIKWAGKKMNATVSVPGRSVEGRDIPVVRIGSEDPELFHAVIICGQHSPAETMCAHILRPMLEETETLGIMSKCVFHLVPTVNVDCAHYGGNGCNASDRNTNRHWTDGIQPENKAVIDYLQSLKEKRYKVGLAIDFHAGGCWRNAVTFYHGSKEDAKLGNDLLESQQVWLKAFEQHAGIRIQESCSMSCGRGYAIERVIDMFNAPAFLVELSLASYFDPDLKETRVFSQDCLGMVGRGIARAIAGHLIKKNGV
ncbi:MAG: M14 family zinc carboxypeptidase [Kiritimatiellia bacterium]